MSASPSSVTRESGGTPVIIVTTKEEDYSALVVLSHGLGVDTAEGCWVDDIAEMWAAKIMPHVKFVLPTTAAPTQPVVTLNGTSTVGSRALTASFESEIHFFKTEQQLATLTRDGEHADYSPALKR
jgi:predicted esterase